MSPISMETVPDFDLRQIENVVDQIEKVGPGTVDCPGELNLLFVEIALLVVGQQFRED